MNGINDNIRSPFVDPDNKIIWIDMEKAVAENGFSLVFATFFGEKAGEIVQMEKAAKSDLHDLYAFIEEFRGQTVPNDITTAKTVLISAHKRFAEQAVFADDLSPTHQRIKETINTAQGLYFHDHDFVDFDKLREYWPGTAPSS